MQSRIIFITGTDTGVGKTFFAAMLTRQLSKQGQRVAVLKPICSGGRHDARALQEAAGNVLTLDEVNPWHYRAPLAPLLAARRERKKVSLAQVVKHVRSITHRFEVMVVEGAGGLLSPLGTGFDSRDLIVALKAEPIVVASNRLGVVNQILLTLESLPGKIGSSAQIVLVNPQRQDLVSQTNPVLLRELVGKGRVHVLPWLHS